MVVDHGTAPLPRCLLVLMGATGATGGLLALLAPDLLAVLAVVRGGALATAAFDRVLVWVAELAFSGCALWFWATTAVVTGDAIRGRNRHRRGVPDGLRRLVLAACGLALAGGLVTPAHADDGRGVGIRTGPHLVEGLPLPDRATTTTHVVEVFARATARRQRAEAGSTGRAVVVRPGDTLWDLASSELGRGAGDAEVAERVREIHTANRALIGPDPDLIRPAQRLHLPPTDRS